MFTRSEYLKYFELLALKERAMIYNVHDLMKSIQDKTFITNIKKIAIDEIQHYSYIQWMMNALELEKGFGEKRKHRREIIFGNIKMVHVENYSHLKARCINISVSGMCIESAQPLINGDSFEFMIDLYDKDETLHFFGKIVWAIKIDPVPYTAGIQYRAGVQFK